MSTNKRQRKKEEPGNGGRREQKDAKLNLLAYIRDMAHWRPRLEMLSSLL